MRVGIEWLDDTAGLSGNVQINKNTHTKTSTRKAS